MLFLSCTLLWFLNLGLYRGFSVSHLFISSMIVLFKMCVLIWYPYKIVHKLENFLLKTSETLTIREMFTFFWISFWSTHQILIVNYVYFPLVSCYAPCICVIFLLLVSSQRKPVDARIQDWEVEATEHHTGQQLTATTEGQRGGHSETAGTIGSQCIADIKTKDVRRWRCSK